MSDTLETEFTPHTPTRIWSEHTESNFEARRRELCVADELKDIPGVTTLMLVAFGEQGIKSIDDLAGCATDDLHGWTERKAGGITRYDGILERFNMSRSECDAIILHARIKAGWIEEASLVPLSRLPI
jgi:transcription termination/antitermination protein NusA